MSRDLLLQMAYRMLYTRSREVNKLMKVLGMPEDLFLERTLIDVSNMTKLKYEKMVMTTVLYLGSVFDR